MLLIELKADESIFVGSLGEISFLKGFYAYVGSALNNLGARIQRHLFAEKKFHWHIDYLLSYADVLDVFYKETNKKDECNIANKFSLDAVEGFGCSDCKCESHLFYSRSYNEMTAEISNKTDLRKW